MIRFLSEIQGKYTKLAKIVKISISFNRLVFPVKFNRFSQSLTLTLADLGTPGTCPLVKIHFHADSGKKILQMVGVHLQGSHPLVWEIMHPPLGSHK